MAKSTNSVPQESSPPINLLEVFSKYEDFEKGDGVELIGKELAEKLAFGLRVSVEAVLNGDLRIDPQKTYLIRSWFNNGVRDIKIATPKDPSSGQLITSYGTFTTHSA